MAISDNIAIAKDTLRYFETWIPKAEEKLKKVVASNLILDIYIQLARFNRLPTKLTFLHFDSVEEIYFVSRYQWLPHPTTSSGWKLLEFV